ncbi:MAG TPA: hypothetical protein VGE16_12040 [Albitalea sp.]
MHSHSLSATRPGPRPARTATKTAPRQSTWIARLLASYIAWAERSHQRLRGSRAIG